MATRKTPGKQALARRDSASSGVADHEDAAGADALAHQALDHIVRLERRAKLEMVIEIGDYLTHVFFGGDLELARSHSPTKPRALSRLEELAPKRDIAPGQLRIAVAMATQYHALPEAVRDRLSARQHRALLPVQDPRLKSRLARRTLAEKLSGSDLELIVRREQGAAHTGRKPLGDVERAVNAARRALVSAVLEAALEPARVRTLPAEDRARLLRHARTLRERIERITDALTR